MVGSDYRVSEGSPIRTFNYEVSSTFLEKDKYSSVVVFTRILERKL